MLDEAVDLNAISSKGYTALTECIRWQKFDAAIVLLEYGVNPNIPDCQPLTAACINAKKPDDLKLIVSLLNAGASVEPALYNFLGYQKSTVHDEISEHLLARQPNIEFINRENGHTGLHLASRDERRNIGPWILDGANVNAQAFDGKTPLMFAVGDATKTRLLLEHGADVTLTDKMGRTALHCAIDIVYPKIDVIGILLESGADPMVADRDGVTPIQMASNRLRTEAMRRDTMDGLGHGIEAASLTTYPPRHSALADQLIDLPKNVSVSEHLLCLLKASQQVLRGD